MCNYEYICMDHNSTQGWATVAMRATMVVLFCLGGPVWCKWKNTMSKTVTKNIVTLRSNTYVALLRSCIYLTCSEPIVKLNGII